MILISIELHDCKHGTSLWKWETRNIFLDDVLDHHISQIRNKSQRNRTKYMFLDHF